MSEHVYRLATKVHPDPWDASLNEVVNLAIATGVQRVEDQWGMVCGYVVEPWQYELLLATKPVPPADDTASLLRAILGQLERQTAIMRECMGES